jgi:UDP-2,3-diacylglucosamine pyrophosphatase LpxH
MDTANGTPSVRKRTADRPPAAHRNEPTTERPTPTHRGDEEGPVTDRVLVAGDVHLGAANADVEAFDSFLDWVYREHRADAELVLLGDVLDLVRRDPFGCVWEMSETVTRIRRLAAEMPVSFIYGNHDTYLRTLDTALYDVTFRDQHVIESGGARIRFRHGMAFDRFHSDRLSEYLSGPGDLGDIDPTRGLKDPVVAKGRELIQDGKRGLRAAFGTLRGGRPVETTPFPRRESRAHAYLDTIPEDKLVFGHTHTPYVHPENIAANPGSWKTTAPLHNTFLDIQGGDITLHQYHDTGTSTPVRSAEPASD